MNLVAVVLGGTVVNVVTLEDGVAWEPPEGHATLDVTEAPWIGIGWRLEGEEWLPPDSLPAANDEDDIPPLVGVA